VLVSSNQQEFLVNNSCGKDGLLSLEAPAIIYQMKGKEGFYYYFKVTRNSSINKVASYNVNEQGSVPWKGRIFLFATTSQLALGSPPIQVLPGLFLMRYSGQSVKVTNHLHLVQRCRVYGTLVPQSNMT
jgi:hypothetical protein